MSPDQTSNLLQLHPLDTVPMWALYIASVVILLLASEVGYRLSKTMQRRRPDKAEASVGALSGATLALLAFLLAFVTSTAVNSLAARRQSLIDEANAVGTAYLRAGYLAEPTATESRQLLREYVDQRLAARDRTKIAQAISRSEEIHNELWTRAEALAREDSSPTLPLYLSALNDVIDLHTHRINVELVARVPWAIVLVCS